MGRIWKPPGLSWRELGYRIWKQIGKDDVFGRAAEISYFFLISLFPLLLFLTSLLGYFTETKEALRLYLLNYLGSVVPWEVRELVANTLQEILEAGGEGRLSLSLLLALWTASFGMGAIQKGLNIAYGLKETRPWWKVQLVAVLLTVGLAVLTISALALLFFGNSIGNLVAHRYGLTNLFLVTWTIGRWPLLVAFVLLACSLIYRFASSSYAQEWWKVLPGSFAAVVLWLIASLALRAYFHFFKLQSMLYGSLTAVIILMLWLYVIGTAILIGGEINSELEEAEAEAKCASGDP